jgi:hypothetical protein
MVVMHCWDIGKIMLLTQGYVHDVVVALVVPAC